MEIVQVRCRYTPFDELRVILKRLRVRYDHPGASRI